MALLLGTASNSLSIPKVLAVDDHARKRIAATAKENAVFVRSFYLEALIRERLNEKVTDFLFLDSGRKNNLRFTARSVKGLNDRASEKKKKQREQGCLYSRPRLVLFGAW
jgi:hypothetical protein